MDWCKGKKKNLSTWRDSNPRPHNQEASPLPLRYNWGPTKHWIHFFEIPGPTSSTRRTSRCWCSRSVWSTSTGFTRSRKTIRNSSAGTFSVSSTSEKSSWPLLTRFYQVEWLIKRPKTSIDKYWKNLPSPTCSCYLEIAGSSPVPGIFLFHFCIVLSKQF